MPKRRDRPAKATNTNTQMSQSFSCIAPPKNNKQSQHFSLFPFCQGGVYSPLQNILSDNSVPLEESTENNCFGVHFRSKKPMLKEITQTYINRSCVGCLNTSYYNASQHCCKSEPGVMCTTDLANSVLFLGQLTH